MGSSFLPIIQRVKLVTFTIPYYLYVVLLVFDLFYNVLIVMEIHLLLDKTSFLYLLTKQEE